MANNCVVCKGKLFGGQTKFCSRRCQDVGWYNKHKQRIIERSKKWAENNPEKAKEMHKKAVDKFRKEKRERFNELMMRDYRKHKERWSARNFVRRHREEIIKIIGDRCKVCGAPIEEIHHTVYKGLPKRKKIKPKCKRHNFSYEPMNPFLERYCKYLVPLCRKHHPRKRGRKYGNC